MKHQLPERLREIVEALPLRKGMRVLEVGCGPGTLAREIASRIGDGYVLGIDRSAKAIAQANKALKNFAVENLQFDQVAVEKFEWRMKLRFDLAVAIRLGALDGRHPEINEAALRNIARSLKPAGKLFIDGGNPLQEINIDNYRKRLPDNLSALNSGKQTGAQ